MRATRSQTFSFLFFILSILIFGIFCITQTYSNNFFSLLSINPISFLAVLVAGIGILFLINGGQKTCENDNSIHIHFFSKELKIEKHGFLFFFLLLSLACTILFAPFIFCGKYYIYMNDIASDSYAHNYTLRAYFAQNIFKAFPPMWSHNFAFGENIYGNLVFNPFELITYIFGIKYLAGLQIYVLISKITLAGLFFKKYLHLRNIPHDISTIGALLYAFSGHIIARGPWLNYATEAVVFSFCLVAFENYIKNNKNPCLIVLSIFLIPACLGIFYIYTFAVMLGIYSLIRVWQINENTHDKLLSLIRVTIWAVIGAGFSSFLLLPQILQAIEASRSSSLSTGTLLASRSWFLWPEINEILGIYLRTFSSDLQGTTNSYWGWRNYLEGPVFYSGLLVTLVIPSMLLSRLFRHPHFLLFFIPLLMGLFLLSLSPFRNLLCLSISSSYKLITIWAIVTLILVTCRELNLHVINSFKENVFYINIVFLLHITLLGTIFCFFYNSIPNKPLFTLILLILCTHITIINFIQKNNLSILTKRENIISTFLLISLVEVLALSIITTYTQRDILSTSILNQRITQISNNLEAEIQWVKKFDDSFSRIGTPHRNPASLPLLLNYKGSSVYYQFMNKYTEQLAIDFNLFYLLKIPNFYGPILNRPELENMLGMKYMLKSPLETKYAQDNRLTNIGNTRNASIWFNRDAREVGSLFYKYSSESELKKMPIYVKENAIIDTVFIDDDNVGAFLLNELRPEELEKYGNYKKIEIKDIHLKNATALEKQTQNSVYYTPDTSDPNLIVELETPFAGEMYMNFNLTAPNQSVGEVFWQTKNDNFSQLHSYSFLVKERKNNYSIRIPFSPHGISHVRLDVGQLHESLLIDGMELVGYPDKPNQLNLAPFGPSDPSQFEKKETISEVLFKWKNINPIANFSLSEISYFCTTDDPQVIVKNKKLICSVATVTFQIEALHDSEGQIFWQNTHTTKFNENESRKFNIQKGTHTYEIELGPLIFDSLRFDIGLKDEMIKIRDLKIKTIEPTKGQGMNITSYSDNEIKGNISVANEAILFFSIPYNSGWKLLLNGKPTKLYRMNIAFMGAPVQPGDYVIELCFSPSGLKTGSVISSTSLLILIFLLFHKTKHKKRA
ncbi:Bacterial membrane protein YfhO [Opitutaceae bacterium TAV1]|nr:Bacterial membrane protein YfhO [Opitutaceae bacterium TAV1]